jgi:hypothetical protein
MQFEGQIISVFQKIAETADLGRSTDSFDFLFLHCVCFKYFEGRNIIMDLCKTVGWDILPLASQPYLIPPAPFGLILSFSKNSRRRLARVLKL